MLAGWAAHLSAAATLATLITGIMFFAIDERFGKVNDAASVVQMLSLIPVALRLSVLSQPPAAWLSMIATVVGVLSLPIAAAIQALLVFGAVRYEQAISAALGAGGGVGLWLLAANLQAILGGSLPNELAALGLAGGAGYILTAIGFHLGGEQHPVFYGGTLLLVLGYSAWAVWLGTLLLSGWVAPVH